MKRTTAGFCLALVAQVALLAALPWERAGDEATGRTVWLKAAARNRQDVAKGEYLELEYEISALGRLSGAKELKNGDRAWVVMQLTAGGMGEGLRVVAEPPEGLLDDQLAIRGEIVDRGLEIRAFLHETTDGSWAADSIVAGHFESRPEPSQEDRTVANAWVRQRAIALRDIESYFVPESERARIDDDLRAHPQEVTAQVRVDGSGGATLLQVRIHDRAYDF